MEYFISLLCKNTLRSNPRNFFKVNISDSLAMVSLRKQWEIYPYGYFCTPKSEGFVRQYFSIMQKGKITPQASESDVIPAMVSFWEEAAQRGDMHELPGTLQEMSEDIFDSEAGDSLEYRSRILTVLRFSRLLSDKMGPFPDAMIIKACNAYRNG